MADVFRKVFSVVKWLRFMISLKKCCIQRKPGLVRMARLWYVSVYAIDNLHGFVMLMVIGNDRNTAIEAECVCCRDVGLPPSPHVTAW